MKKRIWGQMVLLAALLLVAVSAALCAVYYTQFSRLVRDELRGRAEVFRDDSPAAAEQALREPGGTDVRFTVVAPGGAVVLDTAISAGDLPNHGDREEIAEAIAAGTGESRRFSASIHEETYYYAVRLQGGYVLRVAKTASSLFGLFSESIPVVVGVLILGILAAQVAAGRLTRRVILPLAQVDLEADPIAAPYDELAPFFRTIAAQRRQIKGQLRDLEERASTISAILDSMREGLILLDARGGVLAVNRSAADFFGIGEPAEGKNILELFRDIEMIGLLREALRGHRGEMDIARGERIFRAFLSPVESRGAMLLFLDITERLRAETLRREFSANVSHELKTPLTTIYGHAEMLQGGMVQEADKPAFYSRIRREAERLIALIDDILLLSRLDEGAGGGAREAVDLLAAAREAGESLRERAERGGVSVEISGASLSIPGNRTQLYELFYNLLDNAIKYNRPGGAVRVELAAQGGGAVVTVSDTGIGIPREAQGRVFERFYRVDPSRAKSTGGTGLGLAIAKHIALAHGGTISLRSEEGRGTEIEVTFPAAGQTAR